jgi:hypothetical protein
LAWLSHLIIIPPWQNPDEPTHFEYLKIFMDQETFSLAIQPDFLTQQAIIKSMDRYRYWDYVQISRPDPLPDLFQWTPFLNTSFTQIGLTPPFYYLLVASILSPFREKSLETQFYLARGVSMCFGLLTLFLIYFTAKELLPNKPELISAILAFVGLLPQFNLVATSVNPDSLANLLATGVIYLLILLIKGRAFSAKLTLAASFILLGLITKRTTFMTIPLTGIVLLLLSWNHLKGKSLWAWVMALYKITNAFLLLLGSYMLLTWYFPEALRGLIREVAPLIYQSPFYLFHIVSQLSVSQARAVILHLFRSFWYTSGWMKYQLSDSWYLSLKILSILALSGVIFSWFKIIWRKTSIETWRAQGFVILIFSCFLTILGVFLDSSGFAVFTQGRYLFPSISAFAILGVLGLYQLVPKKWHRLFTTLLVLGFLLFNVWTFWVYTIPTFYDFLSRTLSHQLAFDQPVGEIFGNKKVGQTFLAEANRLNRVDLFLATYARTNTKLVIFHLKERPDSARDLATQTLSARRIGNNTYHRFQFPSIPDSQGKSYYIYLESPESQPGNAITAWYKSEDFYKKGSLFINEVESKGDLAFKTAYEFPLTAFFEGLTRNKPFPLGNLAFYLSWLILYGLSVLSFIISVRFELDSS